MRGDFYAEHYELEDRHWWFTGRRAVLLRVLDHHVGPASPDDGRRVLDVGCGTGGMLQALGRYGAAEGVDADAHAIDFCRRRGIDRVQRVADLPLPFGDASFDLVTALDVIEHVHDDAAMVSDMRRVLRPGGSLLLSVPAYRFLWGPQDEIAHHKRRYVARELRARLVGADLAVERLSYFNTFLFPVIAAVRLLRPYRPGSPDLKSDFELKTPDRLNALLARVFALEASLVQRISLPFGVSILALATRRA
jgi:SAM-dependent methyltransferase